MSKKIFISLTVLLIIVAAFTSYSWYSLNKLTNEIFRKEFYNTVNNLKLAEIQLDLIAETSQIEPEQIESLKHIAVTNIFFSELFKYYLKSPSSNAYDFFRDFSHHLHRITIPDASVIELTVEQLQSLQVYRSSLKAINSQFYDTHPDIRTIVKILSNIENKLFDSRNMTKPWDIRILYNSAHYGNFEAVKGILEGSAQYDVSVLNNAAELARSRNHIDLYDFIIQFIN